MKIKGQGAIEVLVITGAIFIIIAILFFSAQKESTKTNAYTNLANAQGSLLELETAGRAVYEQGIGAATTLTLSMPYDIKKITFENRTAKIHYNSGKNQSWNMGFDVYGSIATPPPGPLTFRIKNTNGSICFGNQSACK
ncbi:MAG TPA: hypothetical protein VJB90_03720 [Candidatus Nanoarchaeia archaeon]|nr:hypothetical protein [Candidatus Nanoarchaeia archaeon]